MALSARATIGAVSLSLLAGFVDAVAFIFLGGFFVSFMSGNTTQGGVMLAQGQDRWLLALALAGCFVAGVVLGTLAGRLPRQRSTAILGLVTLFLVAGALLVGSKLPGYPGMLCLAVAMGAVNTIFVREGQTLGLTYVTGALVKVGEGIVAAFSGGPRWAWLVSLLLWLGIALGAVLGALSYGVFSTTALWFAAAGAVAIGIGFAGDDARRTRRAREAA